MRVIQIGILGAILGLTGCAAEDPRASATTACELRTVDALHPASTMDEQLCELLRTAAPEAAVTLERSDAGSLAKLVYANPEEGLRVIVVADAEGRPGTLKRMRNLLVIEEERLHYDGVGHLVSIERLERGELASTVELTYAGDRVVSRSERDQGGSMLGSMNLEYRREGAEVVSENRNGVGQVVDAVTYEHQSGPSGLLEKIVRRDGSGATLEVSSHQYDGARLKLVERRDGAGVLLGSTRYSYVGEGALSQVEWLDAAGAVANAIQYRYDDGGRVSAREVHRGGRREAVMSYAYDDGGTLHQIAIAQ